MSEHLLEGFKGFIVENLEGLSVLVGVPVEDCINNMKDMELSAFLLGCFMANYGYGMCEEIHEYLDTKSIKVLLEI